MGISCGFVDIYAARSAADSVRNRIRAAASRGVQIKVRAVLFLRGAVPDASALI